MPLVRYGLPGLLGSIAGSNVVAASAPVAAAISRRAARHAQQQQHSAAYTEAEQAVAAAEAEAAAAERAAQQYARLGPVPPQPAAGQDDVVSRLDDLARLRDAGVLSAAEFEAAKGKLLGP
ncbi:MAG TPA: SHOCT domain-containing protein [Streptosporangiaceae bacterium]